MFNLNSNSSMEQNNPRTQGFIDESKKSLASFRAGREMVKRHFEERVDTATGNVIPAHFALCFFVAKKDAQGNKMRGANGGLIAEPGTMQTVAFGPSVGEGITLAELASRRDELEVGLLKSGNAVLYAPNYNGIQGEEAGAW